MIGYRQKCPQYLKPVSWKKAEMSMTSQRSRTVVDVESDVNGQVLSFVTMNSDSRST